MLVKDRMTPDPVTVMPDTPFTDAFEIIRARGIHHLPVVDRKGKLVGVVTQKDLLQASPSSATTLTVFEMNYLLVNLKIKEVMSSPPVTVPEHMPVEEAAKVMVENDIGCLPVMRGSDMIGMITETDVFKAFVEILGHGEAQLRITIQIADVPGELARLSKLIAELGGNISSSVSFPGKDQDHVYFTIRLRGVEEGILVRALEQAGEKVVHVCSVARECS